ncbi:MAG: winged helix DNA-binding domain-containing protein [Thermoleophilia bacterium]
MAPRTLGPRALNRAVLARQGLLRRLPGPLPRAAARVGGIQAQYAPSIYVGLWSRVEGVEREAVTRALERRSLVQATLLRGTIHVVAAADLWPFALAGGERMRGLWLRTRRGVDDAAMREAAALLAARLAEGPVARREAEDLLGRDRAAGVGFWLPLVRVPPSGTWERRRADLWGDAVSWAGPPPEGLTRAAAIAEVARRRLAAFGPATPAEVADWAGVTIGEAAAALDAMDLRHLRDESGRDLLDLPRAPLPDPDTPAPPRFLPTWDAALLVHCRHAGILREEDRPRIFSTRMPQSLPVFLVDGTAAGTWRHEDGRITLDPWRRLPRADRLAVEDEAARLAAFHA